MEVLTLLNCYLCYFLPLLVVKGKEYKDLSVLLDNVRKANQIILEPSRKQLKNKLHLSL